MAAYPVGTRRPAPGPPGGPDPPGLTIRMLPVTRGPCDHAHAEVGYHPSRKLAHLIRGMIRRSWTLYRWHGRPAKRP